MSHSPHIDCEMRAVMPATLEAIEDFFAEFRVRSQLLLCRSACFAAELLVREALTNAVVHGSHTDPGRQVRCSLRLKGRCLVIAVEDDGDGFDWRAAWKKAAEAGDCSGRGIEILRRYSNRVRYNQRGNVVTMFKRVL
jgi:anti-sigma regulatory factor (Ser/Thr protein kinase)